MKQIIISLLGLSLKEGSKPLYLNNTDIKLTNGNFINSIDVLLNSFTNEKFIFFGTKEAIKRHKIVFNHLISTKYIEFIEYDDKNLNDIFYKIITTIQKYKDKNILFDITHSYRDSVIMSVISTIVSQIVYSPNIKMIYAKEIKRFEKYEYELVSEEILNTSNVAFILSSFISTLRIPPLNSKYELFGILNNFSNHLLSNQFKDIYESDIYILKNYINKNRDKLFFVSNLLKDLEKMINEIESTKNKDIYEKFLFFSKLFLKKDYYLHSSTYLIESITYYIGKVFSELKFIDFDYTVYKNQQKIVNLLKLNHNLKDFNFPHEYFVDVNIKIIDEFYYLREEVANIRHNLVHINIEQNYKDIKNRLKNSIEKFEDLIEKKVLYKLDTSKKYIKNTIKYHIEIIQKELEKFKLSEKNVVPKLETILTRYKNGEIEKIQGLMDIEELIQYLEKNIQKIEKLFEKKEKRELIL